MNVKPAIKNMMEFSRLSGISRPTIAKYFDDPSSVRASTREKIEALLKKHEYRPNLLAVNLNRRRPKIIGLIVPELTDPFFARLAAQIEAHCHSQGLLAHVLSSRGDPNVEAAALETLLSLRIAGAIVAPLGHRSRARLVRSLHARTPVVFLDSRLDELDGTVPFVGNDNHQSVALITEYLCRTGTRPTFLEAPDVNHTNRERRSAYLATMEQLGLQPEFVPVGTRRDWRFEEIGYTVALQWIDRKSLPTRTLLCANDRLAMGVMAAAFHRRIKVGRGKDCHLRVAGHDDQPLSRYTCPPLTTVAQDVERLSSEGLKRLVEQVDSGRPLDDGSSVTRLEAKLMMRASA